MRRGAGKTKKLLLLFPGLVLLIALLTLVSDKILIVNNLSVDLRNIDCANEVDIKNNLQVLGKNILLLNSHNIEDDVKKRFICIKDVKLYKKLPNSLTLEILPRVPVAVVSSVPQQEATSSAVDINRIPATPSAGLTNYLVDEDGVIFSTDGHTDNLAYIYIVDSIKLGEDVGDLIKKTIYVLGKIKIIDVYVVDSEIYKREMLSINNFGGKPRIIFNLNEKIDEQLASLQLILAKAKIDEEIVKSVDLRFENPVVKYAPRNKN